MNYNVKCNRESDEVSESTTQSWNECLPEILEGYNEANVLNMDEKGLFGLPCQKRDLQKKGKVCKGEEKRIANNNYFFWPMLESSCLL